MCLLGTSAWLSPVLQQLLREEPRLEFVGRGESAEAALELIERGRPELLVVEEPAASQIGEGFYAAAQSRSPRLRMLVVSARPDELLSLSALPPGVSGYLAGNDWPERLVTALLELSRDRPYFSQRLNDHLLRQALRDESFALGSPVDVLSDRELEVLEKLGRRSHVREVAQELRLSVKTIETHRSNIARKLDLPSGAAVTAFAATWLAQQGLVAQPDP